jgi:hypothetical protein
MPVFQEREIPMSTLLQTWREVLSGATRPEVISVPPDVERVVQDEIRRLPRRPSAEAVARLRLEQFLEHAHPGQTVLCMKTPDGTALLAAGEEEVGLFWRTYPHEVGTRIDVHYPPSS